MTATTCGYSSCPSPLPGHLNVHLVSHSHDDVGWLRTVDEYYTGGHGKADWEANQRVGVQDIIDSVVRELLFDESKRWWDNPVSQIFLEQVHDVL